MAHETFELPANTLALHFDVIEPMQFIEWSANAVLIEKSVNIYDVSDGLFKTLSGSDRYKMEIDASVDTLWKISRNPLYKEKLKNQFGNEILEDVSFRIFIPFGFIEKENGFFQKKIP
jgi:hypothetical protein